MEKKLIQVEENSSLENLLHKIMSEKGDSFLAVNIPRKAKILANPLAIKTLEAIAKKEGLNLEVLVEGEPLPNGNGLSDESETEKKSKLPQLGGLLGKIVIPRVLILAASFLILLVGGTLALFYYLPQATVSILVENEVLSKGVDIQASPSAKAIDKEKRVIPAQGLSFTQTLEKTVETTGEKEVGEKAKGTTTIYNKTDTKKTFPKGTALYQISAEEENLKYLTLEEVEVPARTADITAEAVTYISGKKDVAVEAEKIGAAYNLSEGEELSVENYSTNQYIARTNEGISGGSSKIIKIATEADITKAVESAQTDLKFKAFESFENKTGQDQFFSPEAVYLSSSDYNANHQAGEEAESVTVKLTAHYKAITFYQSDVKNLMNLLVKDFVPSNFSLSEQSQDISIEDIRLEESDSEPSLYLTGKFTGLVVPELDSESLIQSLSGKTLGTAQKILDEIPKKTGYEIKISPNLPDFIKRLPFREKNIRVEVVSQ